MVATFLLSQKWSNRNNSQSLSQIREIEGLENQLAEIPTGYVNGLGKVIQFILPQSEYPQILH